MNKNDSEFIEEIWKILNETARRQEESEKEIREIRALIRTLIRDIKETDKEIKKVNKMVGELTDGWGKFVEGLSEPSIRRYFEGLGMELWEVGEKKRKVGGEEIQIDLLCVGKENNKRIVIAMEVKSYLTRRKIEEFIRKLERFKDLFFEYRDIELRGGVGGVRMSDDAVKFAQSKGLYVFSVSDDIMVNINPSDFKPRAW